MMPVNVFILLRRNCLLPRRSRGDDHLSPEHCASNHYHEDAEHFQYVISGEGIVYTNEQPHRLRPGDIVYNYEREHHYFECDGSENFVFVEFFVPGEFKTVWVEDAPICTWEPTGKNIKGGAPSPGNWRPFLTACGNPGGCIGSFLQ